MNKRVIIFLLALLLGSIACQAVSLARPTRLAETALTITPSASAVVPSRTPGASPTVRPPTNTPTASPTVRPPTSTPSPIPTSTSILTATATPHLTATNAPLTAALQRQIFEELWQIVHEEYLYQDFNGLDWDAVYGEYCQKIDAGLTAEDFYRAMSEMINNLGDDHSAFLDPYKTHAGEAGFEGEYDYDGVGLVSVVVSERNLLVVVLVFPDSPAARAGIKIHDSVLAINGEPVLDENGSRIQTLRGPVGSKLSLTIKTPGGEPHEIILTRERITGSMPVPYEMLETPQGKKIGYILLVSFSDRTIVDQVEKALIDLSSASGRLDGLIIDNRQNSGGADTVVRGVLANFTHGTVGHFVNRKEERAFNIIGQDIYGTQEVPLVVLVGRETISFGEIFAGILQDLGRAYVIGQTTDGNVETLYIYHFPDGSSAWIAHDTFQALNDPDSNWEETGIVPDKTVISNWDQVTVKNDPVILAALDYFDQ